MLKNILAAVALSACCLTAGAQALVPQSASGIRVERKTTATPQLNIKKAPAKIDLANNQRLLGYYTANDNDVSEYGIGIGRYCTGDIMPGVFLEKDIDYANYIGAKVVGVRFYLPESTASAVAVYQEDAEGLLNLVCSQDADVTTTGWHTVMLDESKQFVLTDDMSALMVGVMVDQKDANTFPIGYYNMDLGRGMWVYCDISETYGGSGEGWYNLGTDYTFTNQLLVESDNFPDNAVVADDFGRFVVAPNGSKSVDVDLTNLGSTVSSIDYTIECDGQTSSEQHVDLTTPMSVMGTTTLSLPFAAAAQPGAYPTTLTITKVNGMDNEAADKTALGTNVTVSKVVTKRSVIEEATGTACGWCPRGHVGMAKVRAAYPDQFIGIAVHRYKSSDPMYCNNYDDLIPTGNAPLCYINRAYYADPYSGYSKGIVNDFAATLNDIPEVDVTVRGLWNDDQTEVAAKADVEGLVDGDYTIAFALVADSLTGASSAWFQANYYSSSYAESTGYTKAALEKYYPDLAFLWDMGSSYKTYYNDVLIAASYVAPKGSSTHTNKAVLDPVKDGQTTSSWYTLSMPTKKLLKSAINKELVSVVALVMNEDGVIVNAAKSRVYTDATGISNVTTDQTDSSAVVARYTLDGRQVSAPVKGLNILKLANGKTVKVMVK